VVRVRRKRRTRSVPTRYRPARNHQRPRGTSRRGRRRRARPKPICRARRTMKRRPYQKPGLWRARAGSFNRKTSPQSPPPKRGFPKAQKLEEEGEDEEESGQAEHPPHATGPVGRRGVAARQGQENPREDQVAEAEKRPHRPQPLRHQVAHGAGEDRGLQAQEEAHPVDLLGVEEEG
jgi:hypothetical protein